MIRKWRLSRTGRQYILVALACTAVVGGGCALAYRNGVRQLHEKYEADIGSLNEEIKQNQRYVYYASADGIAAGDRVDASNTERAYRFSDVSQEFFIEESDLGKTAVIDIPSGAPILSGMLMEKQEKDVREVEYAMFTLSNNLQARDFIDVRIMYPNGENYSVCVKKSVRSIDLSMNDVFLWVDEEEQQLLSAAIVDTYLHPGTALYVTKYIEDGQEPIEVTYQPGEDVLLEMANNPNITEEAIEKLSLAARKELEERLEKHRANNGDIATGQKADKVYTTPDYAASTEEAGDMEAYEAETPEETENTLGDDVYDMGDTEVDYVE